MAKEIRLSAQVMDAVARVTTYIEQHPLENKTTSELAEYAGISRNLLQQAFKKIHDTHIKKYYSSQKMEAAKQLLEAGTAIRQVAKHCRYRSHSAFTTAFKNKFGITPHAWLKTKDIQR